MRILIAAALVSLTTQAAFAETPRFPPPAPDPNPESLDEQLPPLGCRHLFPPHAWCVEQAAAAAAFARKCERLVEGGGLSPKERRRWEKLYDGAQRSWNMWCSITYVQQDVANGFSEDVRRFLLRELYDALGPDAFFAGRMPPPVPPGAPRD